MTTTQPSSAREARRLAAPGAGAEERTHTIHPRLHLLSWRFEHRGIRWCSLEPGAPPGPEGGTLRCLVAPQDLDRAEHTVRATAGIVIPSDRRPYHRRRWLLRDPDSGTTLELQVTTRLGLGLGEPLASRMARGILVNRIPGPVPRIADAERFWWSVLRELRRPHGPDADNLRRLRELARRVPVDASPLADVVPPQVTPRWTAAALLDTLEDGRRLPRGVWRQAPGVRFVRPSLSPRRWPQRGRSLGMTVVVVAPEADGAPTLRDPPRWPFPVHVADVAVRSDEPASSDGALRRFAQAWWVLRRQQVVARGGALVLVVGHPYAAVAHRSPRRVGVVLHRLALALLPAPDAIAVLTSTTDQTHRQTGERHHLRAVDMDEVDGLLPRGARKTPVLVIEDVESAARRTDGLGRALWELLSWRLATSDLDH
jgi:hypothetical protein